MNISHKILLSCIVIFLPIAMMALIVSSNEYTAQGIEGIDCDSPLVVMLFVLPSYLVYGLGFIVFLRLFYKTRKVGYLLIVIFCSLLILVITPNFFTALNENNNPDHKDVCGEKW